MIAVPCSPTVPLTRMRSPGRSADGGHPRPRIHLPDAGGAHVHLVGVSALHHLGVAGDHLHPGGARGGSAMASTSALSSSAASPSSRISDRLSPSGRAPDTARSFTVPFTASSPIEPPGNRIGLTT